MHNSIRGELHAKCYNVLCMVSPPAGDGWNWQSGCTSTVSTPEVASWGELQLRAVWVTSWGQHGTRSALYGGRQVRGSVETNIVLPKISVKI